MTKTVYGVILPPAPVPIPDPLTLTKLFTEAPVIENLLVDPQTDFKATSFTLTAADMAKGIVYLNTPGNITITMPSRAEMFNFFGNISNFTNLHFVQVGTFHQISVTVGADCILLDRRQNNGQKYFNCQLLYIDNTLNAYYEIM